MTTQMDGELEIDGVKVKWDRKYGTLSISWDVNHHLNIGGKVDRERFKLAILAYSAGYNYGYGMGKKHKALEIRRALDVV